MSSPAPDALAAEGGPSSGMPASGPPPRAGAVTLRPPAAPRPEPHRPALGLAADDPLVRRRVREALEGQFRLEPVSAVAAVDPQADVSGWLVFLSRWPDEDTEARVSALMEASGVPVWVTDEPVPDEESPAWGRWVDRLTVKCRGAAGAPGTVLAPSPEAASVVPPIWVLGASLGGPEAVKRFLDPLPPDPGVAFLYVQHGDGSTLAVLARVLGRHSAVTLRPGAAGVMPRAGDVVVMPADRALRLDAQGVLVPRTGGWSGTYRPDIAAVLRDTLASGHLGGAVLFSGMGDDGASALPAVVERGLPVWAQTPETCASPAMVEAARATGAVRLIGDPEVLAGELCARVSRCEGGASAP
jgi:chemosensory pili system protein ChpB (putative protein-glutamate methylesterase)